MFRDSQTFSSFAVDDLDAARTFYGETLGLEVSDVEMAFGVDDVAAAVDSLNAKGVEMLRYDQFEQDEKGIVTEEGPQIAWFNDPAGNVLSVVEAGF